MSPLIMVARRAVVCSRLLRRPFVFRFIFAGVAREPKLEPVGEVAPCISSTVCVPVPLPVRVFVVWTGIQSTASEPEEQGKLFSGVSYGASLSQPGLHVHDAPRSSRIKRMLSKR